MDLGGRGDHAWVSPPGMSRAMWRRNPIASNRDSVGELFQETGDDVAGAASLLETLLRRWWARPEIAAEMRRRVQHGNRIAHDLRCRLQRSFGLPFECSDALALASSLEDVLDDVDEAAEHVVIFKLGAALARD